MRILSPCVIFVEVLDGCPQYTFSRGIFESPFYPTAYPHNTHVCLGRIQGPPNSTIQLRFYGMDIEYAEDCVYDYIMVSSNLSHTP